MQNRSNRLIGAVLNIDTRLVEIGLGGFTIIAGLSVFSRDARLYAVMPFVEPLTQWLSSGKFSQYSQFAHAICAMILVIAGIIMLWNVASGMINNNHYLQRCVGSLLVSALWTGISLTMLFNGVPFLDAAGLLWWAAVSWVSALLLVLKSEAVLDGCASLNGAICSVAPPQPTLSKQLQRNGATPHK